MDQPSRGAKTGQQGPAAAKRPLRVLLADDNPLNRTIIREYLARRGHEAVLAEHGAEAVDLAVSQPFDIVLMDIQMPVMDGLEATRRIREHQARTPGPRARIMALTAYAGDREMREVRGAKFDRILLKPLDFADLDEALWDEAPGGSGPDQPPAAPARPALAIPLALARAFLEDTPPRLDKARELMAAGDLAALRHLAHYLVNSALAVREKGMEGAARRLEAACENGDAAGAGEALGLLDAAVRDTVRRFGQAVQDKDDG